MAKNPVGSINNLVYYITNTTNFIITLEKDFKSSMSKRSLPHLVSHIAREQVEEHVNSVHEITKDVKCQIKEVPSYL